MILSKKGITKALISLRGCAGWSAPVLYAYPRRQIFSCCGPFILRIDGRIRARPILYYGAIQLCRTASLTMLHVLTYIASNSDVTFRHCPLQQVRMLAVTDHRLVRHPYIKQNHHREALRNLLSIMYTT